MPAQAPSSGQSERKHAADDRSRAESRVEVADSGIAQLEQVDRDDDVHGEGAGTNVCAVKRPMRRRREGSRAIVRKPMSTSEAIVDASVSRSRWGRDTGSRMTKSPESNTSPTLKRKTVPVLVTPRRSPAIAGPTKTARLSTVLATAFAAVSSRGDCANEGVMAACAGLKGVAIAAPIASA